MNIYIKSVIEKNDFKEREKINPNVEIQLFKEFSKKENFEEEMNTYIKLIKSHNINIEVIHFPIIKGADILIEKMVDEKSLELLDRVCNFANEVGKFQNKSIPVVVHAGFSFREYVETHNKLRDIDNLLIKNLNKYPHIEFAIENIIPILNDPNQPMTSRGGFLWDNAEYAKYFNSKYNYSNRVGTVLDTCHALTTITLNNFCKLKPITLEDYIRENSSVLKLIHLANIGDNGYGQGNHGILFETADKPLLKNIMSNYIKYNCTCPITIEVIEKDYLKCENYKITKHHLDNVIKSLL